VVEHSLGKGEVDSSILSGSTSGIPMDHGIWRFQARTKRGRKSSEVRK
jgi:hypothetical protein